MNRIRKPGLLELLVNWVSYVPIWVRYLLCVVFICWPYGFLDTKREWNKLSGVVVVSSAMLTVLTGSTTVTWIASRCLIHGPGLVLKAIATAPQTNLLFWFLYLWLIIQVSGCAILLYWFTHLVESELRDS